jgi:hypothetical protein
VIRSLGTLIFIFSALFIPKLASARTVYLEQIATESNRMTEIEVWSGYGLNINFIPTGQIIQKVWLDDPSRITLSFDGQLCQPINEQNCTNKGATVIHLKQIEKIEFPNIPQSATGATLLTIITEGNLGRNLYQFKVRPAFGEPEYTTVNIKRLPPPASSSLRSPLPLSESLSRLNESQKLANVIHTGLVIAIRNGAIERRTQQWEKAKRAMNLIREGATLKQAANNSNIELSFLDQLIKWGKEE